MTDDMAQRLIDTLDRSNDLLVEIAQSLKQIANPLLWSCGCGHCNPLTFPTCAQCGRKPGAQQ